LLRWEEKEMVEKMKEKMKMKNEKLFQPAFRKKNKETVDVDVTLVGFPLLPRSPPQCFAYSTLSSWPPFLSSQ
jgi:predicted nucleotidyltransferase